MTVKIAFLDPAGGNYTPDTPRLQPLGGSQSALCYLAEALAAAGLQVTLVNGTRTPGLVRGVRCLPAAAMPWEGMRAFDVVVLLNGCPTDALTRLRAALDGGRKLILWMQHAVDQPAAQCLAEPQARACWDGYAFVSRWQMDGYLKAFGLDPGRCRILRNGIAPAFSSLFPAGANIMAAKPWPPVLAYTSTPFRGLDVLLDSVPRLRTAIPGTIVRVFSSLEGYQIPAARTPTAPSTSAAATPRAWIMWGPSPKAPWRRRCATRRASPIRTASPRRPASPSWRRWPPGASSCPARWGRCRKPRPDSPG